MPIERLEFKNQKVVLDINVNTDSAVKLIAAIPSKDQIMNSAIIRGAIGGPPRRAADR